jgi:uncharacterized membrane protein
MKKNMGSADRIIRASIAALIAILFLTQIITGIFGVVLLAIAAIFVLTSVFSFCPLYTLVGFNTCRSVPEKKNIINKQKNQRKKQHL